MSEWSQQKVAKIVHCGLSRLHVGLLGAYTPILATRTELANYGASRKFWKKLSTSVVLVKRKLRRLSSVGSTDPLITEKRPPAKVASSVLT
jgi:hypothetical protein